MDRLRSVGVPENAFTFLKNHVTIDVGHNKAMERYCESLILDRSDLDSVTYALRVTSHLYTKMIEAAVSFVDVPFDLGLNSEECKAYFPLAISDEDMRNSD
jgi:hypothetical protein